MKLSLFEQPQPEQDLKFPLHLLPPDDALPGPDPTRSFVESIERYGVFNPIIIQKRGDGWEVKDGKRRIKGSRKAGLSTIPVLKYPEDAELPTELGVISNEHRSRNPNDEIRLVLDLLADGKKEDEIAERLLIKKQRVRQIVRVATANPALVQAAMARQISQSVLKRLAKRPRMEQELAAELLENTGQLRMEDVKSVRREAQREYQKIAPTIFELPDLSDTPYLTKAVPAGDGVEVCVVHHGEERTFKFTVDELLALREAA